MLSRIRKVSSPKPLFTIMVSVGLAFVLCLLCRDHALKAAVPVTFLLGLAAVRLLGGRMTGFVVATAAGLIFATFLFEPYGTLAIHSGVDRAELLSFGLASFVVVYFSPGPVAFDNTDGITTPSDRLESWIAVAGYAVVFTALVTLLLQIW